MNGHSTVSNLAKYIIYISCTVFDLRKDKSCILHLKCDGTRAETRFRLSAKRTNSFKSAAASVQLTTGNRGVRISGSNDGCTKFRGSVKGTGYPLHWPVSPSLLLPCFTVCPQMSSGVYRNLKASVTTTTLCLMLMQVTVPLVSKQ